MTFFEWLASVGDGSHEITTPFMVFALLSLVTFGGLLAVTGKLVLGALRALWSTGGRG